MESTPPRGCPSDAELSALQAAEPGRAPEQLARHLAECTRCQQRALFGGEAPRRGARRAIPELPSPKRALVLLLAVLVALAMLLYSLQQLRSAFG
jgi:hypothetical protein